MVSRAVQPSTGKEAFLIMKWQYKEEKPYGEDRMDKWPTFISRVHS